MSINWSQVEASVVSAVKGVLKGDWSAVSAGAQAQIKALVHAGQEIEIALNSNPPQISKSDYQALMVSAHRAIEGVLQTYEAIGIVIAEQAAAAALNVVVNALKTAFPAISFL